MKLIFKAKKSGLPSVSYDWSTPELLLERLWESASALAPSFNELHWLYKYIYSVRDGFLCSTVLTIA